MFVVLLTSIVNTSKHTKWVSLCNQKCMSQPTLINLHPNKYSHEFYYYPFVVKLDRSVGSCNTLNDLPNKVCVPNKTEDSNLSVFNMITGINESETLTKDISWNVNVNLIEENVIHINVEITINVGVNVKNVVYVMFGILLHVVVKMENI